jgi:hypothetical protein
MNVSASIPATVQIRRSRLLVLVAVVAALAAAVTWVVVALVFHSGTSDAASNARTSVAVHVSSAAQDARSVPSLMSLTPARLAAGALGTGYTLPSAQSGPTMASVLASMSPQTRRYTKAVMALTFTQLKAGAAGHP